MSSLPISPNVVCLHSSTKSDHILSDHRPNWFNDAVNKKLIKAVYDKDISLVVVTDEGVDICQVNEKVVNKPDGSMYVIHNTDEFEPTQYEVLVTDAYSGDALIEGALTNAWGVDALIKQFCRKGPEACKTFTYDLETTGEVEVMGAPHLGFHFSLFAWTVNS